MGIDIAGLKKRQEEARSNRGNFFKAVDGKNTIRVFTFKHKVTKADVKAGLFSKAQEGKVVEELERVITRQFGIGRNRGPVISTDATIKQWQDMKKQKGEEAARAIAPRKAFMLNVVDTSAKEPTVKTMAAPASVFNAIVDFITDEEYGEEMLGAKGRDFVITFKPNASPSEMYTVAPRKEGKSPKLSSDIEKQVKDLYSDDEYKSFGAVPKDVDADEDESNDEDLEEDDEEEEEEEGVSVEDEEEEDDDSDDSDESEDDEDLEDDDEDSDDEDDEEEEEDEDDEPKKKKKKKK